MKNIIDYVKEFGFRTFDKFPFNDVDVLVLCQIFYMQFEKVDMGLSEGFQPFSVVLDHLDGLTDGFRNPEKNILLAEYVAKSKRYKDLKIGNFQNLYDPENDGSLQAMLFQMEEGIINLIYRGTDNTIIGWKEDLQLAYKKAVTSHYNGYDYLVNAFEKYPAKYRVFGHSKGGNITSVVCTHLEDYSSLIEVIDLDGPGSLIDLDFTPIKDIYHKVVPYECTVGLLLEKRTDYKVVQASGFPLLQHDPYNWDIVDGNFKYLPAVSEDAQYIHETIDEWISISSKESIESFVETVIKLLNKFQIDEITKINFKVIKLVLKEYLALPKEQRQVYRKLVRKFFTAYFTTYDRWYMKYIAVLKKDTAKKNAERLKFYKIDKK